MAFKSMQTLLKFLPKVFSTSRLAAQPISAVGAACLKGPYRSYFSSFGPAIFNGSPIIKVPAGVLQAQQPSCQYHILSRLNPSSVLPSPLFKTKPLNTTETKRTIIKFSMRSGRRKTVKAVVKRFLRLDWGIWIHPKAGRAKHLWRKGILRRKRIRQHVFCNAWQTRTLERMTTKYWHKKKYFVDDPYEPYHTRPDFRITKNIKNIVHQLD